MGERVVGGLGGAAPGVSGGGNLDGLGEQRGGRHVGELGVEKSPVGWDSELWKKKGEMDVEEAASRALDWG